MAKVQVLGPRRLLPAALRFLQGRGVLQLRSPREGLEPRPGAEPLLRAVQVAPESAAAEAALEAAAARAEALLSALPPPRRAAPSGPLPDVASPAFAGWLDALEGERRGLAAHRARLAEEREVVARYRRLLLALAPLRPELPGGGPAETLGLVVRADPEALALLESEVSRITGGRFDLRSRPVDGERLGVLLAVPSAAAREVGALLFERGVEEVRIPEHLAGLPLWRALSLLLERERTLPAEEAAAEEALAGLASRFARALQRAARSARARLERLRAVSQCGETAHAFVLSGWAPAARLEELRAAASRAFHGGVTVTEHPLAPGDELEAPVVLVNPPLLRPFERLLSLVPMPRYGSTDPTPYLALFFPLFFGLVLGDAVFGLTALAVAMTARRRGWGGALGRDLSAVAMACALSAVAFGLLFGEALGEVGALLGLRPVLLHRRRAMLAFLALALAIGAAHVVLGMILGVADALRGRHPREALARVARLAMLLAAGAAIGGLAGVLPRPLLWAGLAALGASTVLGVAAGGLLALLELVLSLGNVMSYARLMALGLASVMLAEVANRMAGSVRPLAAGLGLAVLLHAVNFTLGLVSPAIAALRLHYVEFFEKFYVGGGRPFRPFALGT